MPITKLQFELGIDDAVEEWMRKIAAFLQVHGDEAYTAIELGEALGLDMSQSFEGLDDLQRPSLPDVTRKFLHALMTLREHGVVVERDVAGSDYYSTGVVRLTQLLKS